MALTLTRKKKAKAEDPENPETPEVVLGPDPTFVPKMPSVNLLSPETLQKSAERRTVRNMVYAASGVGFAIVGVWLLQAGSIHLANQQLEIQQAQASSIGTQKAKLVPVQAYYTAVDTSRTAVQTSMANEVLSSSVFNELNKVSTGGVSLNALTLTMRSAPATGGGDAAATAPAAPAGGETGGQCVNPNPYVGASASAGCFSIEGRAGSRIDLGRWMTAVEKSPMFEGVFVPTATRAEGDAVTFSATMSLTPMVYQKRYDKPEFLTGATTP